MTKRMRIVSLLLALLMVLPMLVSCDKGGGKPVTDTSSDAKEPESYEIAVNNYGGATCAVAVNSGGFNAEEETGDPVNDATYRRNAKVEELYKIKFDFPEMDSGGFGQQVEMSIMSGDDAYQIVSSHAGGMASAAINNKYYQDLLDMDFFNFEEDWWPSDYMRSAKIGNDLYFCVGNISDTYYNYFTAIMFNKKLAADYDIEDLYGTVKEGKWTIDKLIDLANMAYVDLDGDGMMDPKIDRFGFSVPRRYPTDAFVTAFDIQLTDKDADGIPTLLPLSDKYVDVFKKLQDFYYSNCTNYITAKSPTEDTSFREGRALFEANRMFFASGYRDMEDDFGILPYPKWDEKQSEYRSFSDTENIGACAIPITTNANMPSNILEALSYFGYQMILPAYYDKALKGRTARDAQSGEMLDIIYNNVYYEFIQIYGNYFYPSPDQLLAQALWSQDTVSHLYNQNRRVYASKMEDLIKGLDVEGD